MNQSLRFSVLSSCPNLFASCFGFVFLIRLPSRSGVAKCNMKPLHTLPSYFQSGLIAACLLMLALNPGCASKPKPDWDQRVGSYTYDEAVRELGPPVDSAKLQDGSTVAEWFLKYGSQMSFSFGAGTYGAGGGVGAGQTVTPPPKAYYLRLTFGADNKLQRWEKIKR
jgi:hypothetical protein